MGMNGFLFGGGFTILFMLVFGLIFAVIIFILIKGIGEWNRNNHSPRLSVAATVVAKRTNVSHYSGVGDNDFHSSSTSYYVTFQVASGDRMEFHVSGSEYGMLIEGDKGMLSFQGSRYLSFVRQ